MKELPALIKKLLEPEAYPHRPEKVELIQTHISYVFLAGDLVYKIKKPVDFGFLDFTTLEKRKFYCEREVTLNRRLCPDIYLGVVPVVEKGDTAYFEREGEPVEWAVKMKRMPEEGMMGRLIAQGRLRQSHLDLIVKKLVPFYQQAETGPEVNKYGTLEAISFNVEENFSQTKDFVGRALAPHRYEHIVSWSRTFIKEKEALFKERIAEGFIRDGHGDLYSANICFDEPKNEVYIFDCIEFNDRFRCGDVAQDLAFLAMDLDFHELKDFSRYFIDQYVSLSGDKGLLNLLDFYKCYRAYVRGKIGCFTWASPEVPEEVRNKALNDARRYFDLAYLYAEGVPWLIVIFGLSGTGKSTLARALRDKLLTNYYNSDIVRKKLLGIKPEEHHYVPFGKGIYSEEFTLKTYEAMARYAAEDLVRGRDVILDATFRARNLREMVLEAVKDLKVKLLFVQCVAPDEVIKARFEERAQKTAEPSDGRWEIYVKQKEVFEPPTEIPEDKLLVLETTRPVEELAQIVVNHLKAEIASPLSDLQ
ncbi:bifunctional aminoglycoside phosphotransferase/ATP-binding protein [Thermodesulfatator autotrophicus]|uniref:Aminoglycoside phosphotransferase n=1 Tax=Thermodesulfatator autotrophicus TaxID=1795632 RepID=A0A177E5A7_9BACT|nr:AAA family ATPase [Thermodesulfatator autotrophicus]OAG27124.1 aminoglycoside phosphotransferase [Thermodesulfatator autotrophicus]